MKILWVVNHYMPDLAEHLNTKSPSSGSWLVEMSKDLIKNQKVELTVICPTKEKSKQVYIKGINYFLVEMSNTDKFIKPTRKFESKVASLLKEIKPDIIHLQGTEFAYGLAFLEQRNSPVVITIQGLISEITKYGLYWADIDNKKFYEYVYPANLMIYTPEVLKKFRNDYRSKAEVEQLKKTQYRIGRTLWDESHSHFHNPSSKYYYLQETIRDVFFEKNWSSEKRDKFTVFCAGGYASPLKGIHKVLEALALLRKEFPYIRIRITGPNLMLKKNSYGYNKYLYKLIKILDLEKNIEFTGQLNSEEMAKEFEKAHVYVLGSSIENSSNTLGEAMSVGTPSIVSYVGGLTSIATDEKEVLFYRFGDIEQLAWQIRRIFKNDNLANRLSENAKKRSIIQYSKENNSSTAKNIYSEIINDFFN